MLDKLEYLLALARERNFGRAAETCGVTQPTFSAGIKQLEDMLGVMLVQRTSRFLGFTAEGERVLDWARGIVHRKDRSGVLSIAESMLTAKHAESVKTFAADNRIDLAGVDVLQHRRLTFAILHPRSSTLDPAFPGEVEHLAADHAGGPRPTGQLAAGVTEVAERDALAVAVAGLPLHGQRPLGRLQRLREAAHAQARLCHVVGGPCLARLVADLPVDGERLLEAADRLFPALQPEGHAEVVQHPRLGHPVAQCRPFRVEVAELVRVRDQVVELGTRRPDVLPLIRSNRPQFRPVHVHLRVERLRVTAFFCSDFATLP